MQTGRMFRIIFLLMVGLIMIGHGESLTDPYRILGKHFEAIGGLESLQALKTVYQEGVIRIEGAGLEGTFKQWTLRPLKLRQEVDLNVVKSTSGDNGEFAWEVDANGKVLLKRDEFTLKDREVRRLLDEYEHLDPESEYFNVTFGGMEKVNGKDCYIVKITNTINTDVQMGYYDGSSFYLVRTVLIKPDRELRVDYSEFRKVGRLVFPFRESTTVLPVDQTSTVEYSGYDLDASFEHDLFEPPAQDVEDFVFVEGRSAENIPFDYIEEHIYLPVNLLGKERLWVLDCGASVNVIDSSFAAELGLAFEGPIKGQGASGVVEFYYVTLPEYEVGGIRFNEQKVVALNFGHLLKRAMGLEIVGILGYDFLSRFVTKIDYANRQISFYVPEHFEYEGDGEVFDSPIQYNMLSLPATVDDDYSGTWRVDIGADGLDFHFPFAREHGLLDRKSVEFLAGDAAGFSPLRLSKYRKIKIGNFIVKDPLIGIAVAEGTGSFAEETTIGNIGNAVLRHFVLYLDYKDQRLILEKGDDFGKVFPTVKSGLQLLYNADEEIEVMFVSPGTPAKDAGFEKGDVVRSINGIAVEYLDGIIALRRMMRAEAGTKYTIEVWRAGKTKTLNLVLRELF